MNELSKWDYMVFSLTLILPLLIGFYYKFTGGGQKTVKEHMHADNEMSTFTVAVSLMASFMSAITMLGLPAEVMFYSTQYALINLGNVIGTPVACYLLLPVFYEKKFLSIYEYLEVRFNRKVRLMTSYLFTFEMILYMGIVLYAPALALSAVTNLPKWSTMVVIGLVCTVYCVCGGIKAVLINDVFQAALMFIGLLLILFKTTDAVGGWYEVFSISYEKDRIQFFNLSLSPFTRHTIWTQIIGGFFLYLSTFAINQTQIQRLLTVPTLKKSQKSLWISLPITVALTWITCFTGLAMFSYFNDCDPLKSGKVKKADQILPYIMMVLFEKYPGLPGLIVASIFAGAISSVASFVNSLAAVTLEDVIKPFFIKNDKKSLMSSENERKAVIISKILAIFYGLLCLLIAYLCEKVNRLLETCLIIFGIGGGPMLAVFTLGMSSRKCNSNGVIWGFIFAIIVGSILGFAPVLTNYQPEQLNRSIEGCTNIKINSTNMIKETKNEIFPLFKISYMWICPITWTLTTLIALAYSYIFPDNNLNVNDDLLIPYLRTKTKEIVELEEIY